MERIISWVLITLLLLPACLVFQCNPDLMFVNVLAIGYILGLKKIVRLFREAKEKEDKL